MSISTQITVVATAEQIIVTAPGALRGPEGPEGPMGGVTPEVTQLVADAEAAAAAANESKGDAEQSATLADDAKALAEAAATEAQAQLPLVSDQAVIASEAADRSDASANLAAAFAKPFVNTADGLANTSGTGATNRFFSVPGTGGSFATAYRNDAGVATVLGQSPSTKLVQEPAWAGKKNGWPDSFFRVFDLTSQSLLGVDRWWCSAGTASDTQTPLEQGGWSRVKDSFFDGYSLRRTANINTTPLNGPVIILSEIDVAEGESITAYQLFSGSGAVINAYVRFDNGADRGYVGNQVGMTTDSGAATLTATPTPQRMKASLVVPAGAKRLMTYAYTATASATFDMIALWAFKGGIADGPNWPTLFDDAVNDYKVLQLEGQMGVTAPATAYAVDSYSTVESTSETITLNGSGFSAFPRDLVFMGWGENYSPAGVTFNALRVKSISRASATTAKWKTLHCVIRTGPAPETSTGVVLAIGKATVLSQNDSLADVTFILRDPASGAVKTLNDASFTNGKYFIGVWALTSAGQPAACGEPRGVMPNSLLQSYYQQSTANKPETGTWNTSSGPTNNRLAFQHLNLINPKEVTQFAPAPAFAAALGVGTPAPELVMPPLMIGLEGREINLYFNNVTPCDVFNYSINVNATVGRQLNECLRVLGTGAVNAGTVTLELADKRSGDVLVATTIQQRVAAATAGAGLTKKCLFIGDSLIAAGTITQTLLDIATTDAMKIELLGTLGSGLNKHEGRGGWSVASYTSAGTASYRFTVSGVVEAPALNAAEYSHNGAVYRVQETNIIGGTGTITCSVVSGGSPLSSGTLTKTNTAAGDSTIAFSASATLSGNPFWFDGAVNFAQYLTTNSIPTPNWVPIGLGTNDMFSAASDGEALSAADTALVRLDVLIASIKAADAGTKVGLIIAPPPSADQDSFGANYAAGQNRDRFKRNILIWARQIIAKYKGQEASRVYLIPSNIGIDTVNNMQRAASAPVNSRSSVMVARQSNGVHPAPSGYQQDADLMWAFLKWYASA